MSDVDLLEKRFQEGVAIRPDDIALAIVMEICGLSRQVGLFNLVRFAHNWNVGILEYWNNGF